MIDAQPTIMRVGDLYWKQDGPAGWMLGQLEAFHAPTNSATFARINEATGDKLAGCASETLDLTETPLFAANPLFSTAADMTSLRHLHEAALAKNLEDRSALKNQRPYTFMANVLIAVNPLRYLEEPDKMSFVGQPLDRCPPHPYNIAENAYRQLCAVRAVTQNQSIIISGESGSGKTETSKIILDFLTMRAAHDQSNTEESFSSDDEMEPELTPFEAPAASPVTLGERLMETIPILESFGNAKTHRNHNSSRFGKYMRLQFSPETHELSGASIDTYLLEKSRLVSQPKGERNFHVFYELLNSEDTEYIASKLYLKPKQPEAYSYLNQSGCMKTEFIDDPQNFKNLCKALECVGMEHEAQDEIFRLVAGLLHLGNATIGEEDTSEGKTACVDQEDAGAQQSLQHAAELLGVDMEQLSECIFLKRIMPRGSRRGSIYYSKKDKQTATYSRDTIAKTIYEHAFNWLMIRSAAALDYDSERSDVIPYIGVLDIFGFEDFEPKNRNSFEQLLINYANETLQSLFNSCIFEAEQELYQSEHIYNPINHSLTFPFAPVDPTAETSEIDFLAEKIEPSGDLVAYSDNRECLSLMGSRNGGLFATIDNVSRMPQPSDRKLNERLHTLFKNHACFPRPHPKDVRDTFIIRHYAGAVKYTIDTFIDKNNNIISDQFEELIQKSSSRVLRDIMALAKPNQAKAPASGPVKRTKGGSSSSLFFTQMKGLTTELEGTNCNFVRCIKPNTQMKAGLFDKPFVVEQLRCSGTVQACEVLRVGLPTRILYAEVVAVYKNLLPNMLQRFHGDDKLFTMAILWVYDFPTAAYRLGDTRLFFRTGKIDLLDKLLTPSAGSLATLETQMLRYLHKKRWIAVATRVIAFNKFQRIFNDCKYRRKATTIQCLVRQHLARKRVRKMRVLHRISAMWNRMAHQAEIMRSFQDRPDDKILLLNKLWAKSYLPVRQRWLLKWLGPLQRVIYLQKLWKKVTTQYLAKRAFISLFDSVRKNRSAVLIQTHARRMIAQMEFARMKTSQEARARWRKAFVKVKVFLIFKRELYAVHVKRLESTNSTLQQTIDDAQAQLAEARAEVERMRSKYKELELAYENSTIEVTHQTRRMIDLERELELLQAELIKLREYATTGFFQRSKEFFSSSSLLSLPLAMLYLPKTALNWYSVTCSPTACADKFNRMMSYWRKHADDLKVHFGDSSSPEVKITTNAWVVVQ